VMDVARISSERLPGAARGRASYATVNILGGQVLILGGYDEQIRLTRIFERIDPGRP
jgi:hypothetical protein